MFTKKGRKPDDVPEVFNTAEVVATHKEADPTGIVTSESLKPPVVPAAEPTAAGPTHTLVNLRESVTINGRTVGPGVNCLVPTDAFDVWRHALATE